MRKLGFLVLGVMAAAGGCSTEELEPADPVPTDGVTQQQLEAFGALQADTHKAWKWVQHEDLKTPLHLSTKRVGLPTLKVGEDLGARTIDVLKANRALFKMRDPELELSASRLQTDHLGMRHARFQQMSHGVPVADAELMAHYDAEGHLTSIDANYISDLADVDVNPRLTVDDSLAVVKAHILGDAPVAESSLSPDAGKLVIYARANGTGGTKLAYEHRVRALAGEHPAIWIYTVDAQNGDILHRYNNLQTVTASGTGVLGDKKTFEVGQSGGNYVMSVNDPKTGIPVKTFTAKQLEDAPGTLVTSTNQNAWDTGAAGRGAAVDAHFNAAVVANYYKTVHNRNSIDGVGGALESTVHFGNAIDNAAWIGTGMIYGDGDTLFKALSVSVDVVGHEFTHGVIEKTSNLKYEFQSGALNEAVADIFGAFIEHSVKPDAKKNWAMGEDVVISGSPLRDMSNPGSVKDKQPGHMSQFVVTQQDEGGVHINSGIINNLAFLMTVGGKNPVSNVEVKYGIGWEKSEKLWYRANSEYFMASTNFAATVNALQQAGKDIGLTSNELAIVDCAYKAVGIVQGTCSSLVNPQSSTGSATDDDDDATTDDDDDSTSSSSSSSKKKKKKKTIVTEQSACSAAGGADFGSFLPVAAAVLAIVTRRRRELSSRR